MEILIKNEAAKNSIRLFKICPMYLCIVFFSTGCTGPQSFKTTRQLNEHDIQAFATGDVKVEKNGGLRFSKPFLDTSLIPDKAVHALLFGEDSVLTLESVSVLPTLENLEILSISGRILPQEFAVTVAKCEYLEYLNVARTNFNDSDLKCLRASKSLKTIDLFQSEVTAIGISSFRAKRPDITILNWYH